MNEHELRLARAASLLQLASEELAPLVTEESPLCRSCKVFVGFAATNIDLALKALAIAKPHAPRTESGDAAG
jgi:hypothetical protein